MAAEVQKIPAQAFAKPAKACKEEINGDRPRLENIPKTGKMGGKWGQTTFKKYSENVICPIFIPWNGSAGDAGNPLLASYIPAAVQKALGVRLK